MTNANQTTVKKSLPNQKQRRKSDPRKPKSRVKRRNSTTETPQTTAGLPTSEDEVEIGVTLFVSLIKKQIREAMVWENFSNRLSEELRTKFTGHWYPDKPEKGSGYRCIRVNGSTPDVLVQRVAEDCGIPAIRGDLPAELTVWIDPGEVSYRIGEEGSVCRHYYFESEQPRPEVKKILTRPRSGSGDSQ